MNARPGSVDRDAAGDRVGTIDEDGPDGGADGVAGDDDPQPATRATEARSTMDRIGST
jgi:hypothetical protein